MLCNKGFKYRAYPAETQRPTLAEWFGCTRFVGNLGIEQRSKFSRRGRSITCAMQMADLPELRAELPWLKECPNQILQQALNDVDKAYGRFFAGLGGYPQRKGKYDGDSFRFPALEQRQVIKKKGVVVVDENGEPMWRTTRLITLGDDWIELPKIGKIRWVKHRPMQGVPKNVTVSREGGMYFVSVCCEVEVDTSKAPAPTVDAIAYDYGVNKNYAMSDGTVFDVPGETEGERRRRLCLEHKIGRQEETRKAREADHRAAGILGARERLPQSSREKRTRNQLRLLDGRQTRRAHDALHKKTTYLVRHAALIGFEGLKVKNMTAVVVFQVDSHGWNVAQKSGLNRGLLHGRPGTARLHVQYKSRWMGRRAVAVPPAFTSQYCSECHRHPKDDPSTSHLPHGRDGERFKCPLCGFECDADWNAARNIEREARRIAALPDENAKPRRKVSLNTRWGRKGKLTEDQVCVPTVGGLPTSLRGATATEQAMNREVFGMTLSS